MIFSSSECGINNRPRGPVPATRLASMRSSAIQRLLDRTGAGWDLVEGYVADGTLTEVAYRGERYFVRRWRTEQRDQPNRSTHSVR